ncbi:hypothetical protein GF351_00325 [Candidatus Woesearchaeota archaeon]|nr:hypothetical protein [Candidatus Woesearchaeota archaeon]
MTFTKQEKEVLKNLVKRELKDFREEEKDIIGYTSPGFFKTEKEYEALLKGLQKKLS